MFILSLIVLAVLALVLFVVGSVAVELIRQRRRNHVRFDELMNFPDRSLSEERIGQNVYGKWLYRRWFGVWFACGTWFGNCFSPAVVLEWSGRSKPFVSRLNNKTCYAAWAILTLRFKGAETRFYWRGRFRFDWASEHVARKWGEISDQDHGTCYFYKGWLGNHCDV